MGGVALASIDGCILRMDEDIIAMQDACVRVLPLVGVYCVDMCEADE